MRALLPVVMTGAVAVPAGAQTEDAALRHARELLKTTILIDGHNDLPWAIRQSKTKPRDVVAARWQLERTVNSAPSLNSFGCCCVRYRRN